MTEKRNLILTYASQLTSSRQKWLETEVLPMGTLTNFVGAGGCGKTTKAIDTAARATRGELEGDLLGQPRNVLFIGHEDDKATQMKPRLQAAGAVLDRIIFVAVASEEDKFTMELVPKLPLDIDLIRNAITETDAALIIIDPLTSTLEGNLYHAHDVRHALNPLLALAQETQTSIIGIQHVRKGQGNASDKTAGSHAFRDISRSLLQFARDEDNDQTIVTIDKSNYGTSTGNSFAFRLQSVDIATDDGEITSVAIVENLGESSISVSDVWNREHESDDGGEQSEIETFILEVLIENGGSAKTKDVLKSSQGQYSESQISKARVRAGVRTKRIGFGKGGVSYWFHPDHLDQMKSIESTIKPIEPLFQKRESMESMELSENVADAPAVAFRLVAAPMETTTDELELAFQGER
jgi:hypothetical protein